MLLQDDEDYADFLENQDDGDVDDPADVLEGSKKSTNDRKKVRLPTDMDKLFTDPPDPGEKVMRGPNIHSQCSECQEEFKSEMKLKEHLKESKHSMEYPCDICKKIFR